MGPGGSKVPKMGVRIMGGPETTDPGEADLARGPRERAWREHNDGHRVGSGSSVSRRGSVPGTPVAEKTAQQAGLDGRLNGDREGKVGVGGQRAPNVFSAQTYLRYQGDKVSAARRLAYGG